VVIKHGNFSIILRPVAVVLVAIVAGVVAWRFLAAGGAAVGDTMAANQRVTSLLTNGDFEGATAPATQDSEAKIKGRKAAITGVVAQRWKDRSRWGDVSIHYGLDTKVKHGGVNAQRAHVKEARNGRAKFCQSLTTLPGKQYRLTLWARSEKPMTVSLGLRQMRGEKYEGQKTFTLGPDWQPLEVVGKASGPQSYFMLETENTGTLWLDDAACVEM
jgi:hypothetical protein